MRSFEYGFSLGIKKEAQGPDFLSLASKVPSKYLPAPVPDVSSLISAARGLYRNPNKTPNQMRMAGSALSVLNKLTGNKLPAIFGSTLPFTTALPTLLANPKDPGAQREMLSGANTALAETAKTGLKAQKLAPVLGAAPSPWGMGLGLLSALGIGSNLGSAAATMFNRPGTIEHEISKNFMRNATNFGGAAQQWATAPGAAARNVKTTADYMGSHLYNNLVPSAEQWAHNPEVGYAKMKQGVPVANQRFWKPIRQQMGHMSSNINSYVGPGLEQWTAPYLDQNASWSTPVKNLGRGLMEVGRRGRYHLGLNKPVPRTIQTASSMGRETIPRMGMPTGYGGAQYQQ